MSTSESVQFIGDIMIHVGDIISTLGNVEYTGTFTINQMAFISELPT